MKNYLKHFIIAFCALLFLSCNEVTEKNVNQISEKHDEEMLKDVFVPDEETAIKIAEAVWLPIFGKSIYEYKPFKATLVSDSIWKVEGTLKYELGGVPYAFIKKRNCEVIKIYHTK